MMTLLLGEGQNPEAPLLWWLVQIFFKEIRGHVPTIDKHHSVTEPALFPATMKGFVDFVLPHCNLCVPMPCHLIDSRKCSLTTRGR